jgi:hypothetical protein
LFAQQYNCGILYKREAFRSQRTESTDMLPTAEYIVPGNVRDRQSAVVYVCVTTIPQMRGPAYQRQLENCIAFAAKSGLTVEQICDDVGGRDTAWADRPGLQNTLAWLETHGNGVLIVEDMGRLSLSADDMSAFHIRMTQAEAVVVYAEEQRIGSPTDEFRADIAQAIQDYRAALIEQVMERSIVLSPETQQRLQVRAQREGCDIHHLAEALIAAALTESP